MQDDKKNIPENDELEDIKMLLGDDDSAPEDADALLDDILKEYEVDGAGKDADPDSLLAELENLTAQFSEDAAVIGETAGEASLAAQEEASEIVEAEHAPDAAAAGEGPAEGTVRVEEVPMDPPRKVSAAQRRKSGAPLGRAAKRDRASGGRGDGRTPRKFRQAPEAREENR